MPRSNLHGRAVALRRDLRLLTADGALWAIMTGTGEWQFVLFALAIGLSEVRAGLVSTVPLFIGAILQLLTPWGVRRTGSLRRWVWVCAGLQGCSLLPLAIGAILAWTLDPGFGATRPDLATVLLFGCIIGYWGAGFATAPPWQAWFTSLVPGSIRPTFVGARDRFVQLGLACGILAGLFLEFGDRGGWQLPAFAGVFLVAFLARAGSTWCLARQSDAPAALATGVRPLSLAVIRSDFADRRTRQLLLYMLAFLMSVMVVGPYFAVYMRSELEFSYLEITTGLFVMMFVKALILPFVGRLAKRIGPGRVLWIGAVMVTPAAALWAVHDQFWWIILVQVYAACGWACWETATFLLIFDTIPAERRTTALTVYQFARSSAFLVGSFLGALVLEGFGVGPTGYVALFVLSSLMRGMTLFMLSVLEPTGLRLRHRAGRTVTRAMSFLPGSTLPD